jgi:murein DD-endopeptidase MepM/ murein hydrolase activator NlpD
MGHPPANTVWIEGADHYITRYVHILPSPTLTLNGKVTVGTQIGTLDNSGCQKNPHLHAGRYDTNNSAVNFTIPCINPVPIQNFGGGLVDDDVDPNN